MLTRKFDKNIVVTAGISVILACCRLSNPPTPHKEIYKARTRKQMRKRTRIVLALSFWWVHTCRVGASDLSRGVSAGLTGGNTPTRHGDKFLN
ncbi:hypothetical protein DPMN_104032 [Dreissena polymorpha]|uniref:Uncharacterized protein n=1 Tax=Dreissena polymorpha TaxID=45954 RepID=A0A9D4K1A4_DREPO|nr:hypothetical protein DPMN_104032 [Dreissena polymorpha]